MSTLQKMKSCHLRMLTFSWNDWSNMMLRLTVHPGGIYTVYIQHCYPNSQTGGEVSAQSSLTLCGYVILSFGGVLSYSMCLWLWGGAPWTVNIGRAREGRRLLCVLQGLSVCQTHYQSLLPPLLSVSLSFTATFSLSSFLSHCQIYP